jgi:hypothetical protein
LLIGSNLFNPSYQKICLAPSWDKLADKWPFRAAAKVKKAGYHPALRHFI